MPVRNSAKALVLRGGKLLVNRCTSRFGEYYALPGGGQREGETLLEAVRRELLEETGYRVLPMRLSAIYERVCAQREGGMSHKLYFVFLCRLEDEKERVPTERDRYQVGMEWVEVEALREGEQFLHLQVCKGDAAGGPVPRALLCAFAVDHDVAAQRRLPVGPALFRLGPGDAGTRVFVDLAALERGAGVAGVGI